MLCVFSWKFIAKSLCYLKSNHTLKIGRSWMTVIIRHNPWTGKKQYNLNEHLFGYWLSFSRDRHNFPSIEDARSSPLTHPHTQVLLKGQHWWLNNTQQNIFLDDGLVSHIKFFLPRTADGIHRVLYYCFWCIVHMLFEQGRFPLLKKWYWT